MMKLIIIAAISMAMLVGSLYAGVPEGKVVFAAKCQACHGPNGEGKAAIAKMFNVTMRPLGSKEIQAKSDAEIRKTVIEGHSKMKPITGLDDKQVADVVAFVRTLKE